MTNQHGQVTGKACGGGRNGAEVVPYTVEGGRHSWPGSDLALRLGITTRAISATDLIWAFFAAHPRR